MTQLSDAVRPVELPPEAEAHSLAGSHASAGTDMAAVLAASDGVHHEPARLLATELLETVSTSAIQLHPAEPTEPMPSAAGDDASNNRGEAVLQKPASIPDAGLTSPEPAHTESALGAEEETATALESAAPADSASALAVEEGSALHQQPRTDVDASSQDAVNSGAGDQVARATSEMEALGNPFAVARTAVQANVALWSYLRDEGAAALAHMRTLGSARSPADLLDLQAHEVSRALGAAQTLGRELADAAGKLVSKVGTPAKDKP